MPADCQIDDCGVLAVGRCHRCRRAFCGSHQAFDGQVRLVDQCSSCRGEQRNREAQAEQDEWEAFLDTVRACEARPFPRLLAGAALKADAWRPRRIPWSLYDPKLHRVSLPDPGLSDRIARDFVEEALRRGVLPERRVRSRRSEKRGFLQRVHWEDVYDEGWTILGGSDRPSGGKSDGYMSAIIWTDGEITEDDRLNNPPTRLREEALFAMADLLGINTVPKGMKPTG